MGMTKPSTATPAAPETEQCEQLPRQASQATWHDGKELGRSARRSAVRIGTPSSRRQLPRLRFKRASSSTAEPLTRTTDVLAAQHRIGASVRVRKRVQRLTPTRLTAFRRFLHALLYAFLQVYLSTRHARKHALRPHEGRGTCTLQRPNQHSRPDQRPATVQRPRRYMVPAQAARRHAEARRSERARGGRRGQPRGRPADTPSRGTTTSTSTAIALPSVLVVDDDPGYRGLLREILTLEGRLEGRAVSMAEHGGPALQRLRASAEGLVVLLGLLMPEMDGEALLEAVSADAALATRHAFVMVTAAVPRATVGRVAELRQLLDIPLIAKPFTVSEILQAVDEATGRLTSGPPVRD
jgi:CheY-like chemotaxis protein